MLSTAIVPCLTTFVWPGRLRPGARFARPPLGDRPDPVGGRRAGRIRRQRPVGADRSHGRRQLCPLVAVRPSPGLCWPLVSSSSSSRSPRRPRRRLSVAAIAVVRLCRPHSVWHGFAAVRCHRPRPGLRSRRCRPPRVRLTSLRSARHRRATIGPSCCGRASGRRPWRRAAPAARSTTRSPVLVRSPRRTSACRTWSGTRPTSRTCPGLQVRLRRRRRRRSVSFAERPPCLLGSCRLSPPGIVQRR